MVLEDVHLPHRNHDDTVGRGGGEELDHDAGVFGVVHHGKGEIFIIVDTDRFPDGIPGLPGYRNGHAVQPIVVSRRGENRPEGPGDPVPNGDLADAGELKGIDDVDRPFGGPHEG